MMKVLYRLMKMSSEKRWFGTSIVFQGAMNVNPVIKIEQIREAIRERTNNTKKENTATIQDLFKLVGLDSSNIDRYPRLSGGMKRRAVITLALSCKPKLIIADEPTTALDVVIQDQILKKLEKFKMTWVSVCIFRMI